MNSTSFIPDDQIFFQIVPTGIMLIGTNFEPNLTKFHFIPDDKIFFKIVLTGRMLIGTNFYPNLTKFHFIPVDQILFSNCTNRKNADRN